MVHAFTARTQKAQIDGYLWAWGQFVYTVGCGPGRAGYTMRPSLYKIGEIIIIITDKLQKTNTLSHCETQKQDEGRNTGKSKLHKFQELNTSNNY